MVKPDSTTLQQILEDMIKVLCYTKDGTIRQIFNRQAALVKILKHAEVLLNIIPDFDIGADLSEIYKQLKNEVGVKTFRFILKSALKLVIEQKEIIDELLLKNEQLSLTVIELSDELEAIKVTMKDSVEENKVEENKALKDNFFDLLRQTKSLRIEEVSVDNAIKLEDLEHKIIKIEFENTRESYSEKNVNFVGGVLTSDSTVEFFEFFTLEDAATWSKKIQTSKYNNGFESNSNPFCPGSVFEVTSSVQTEDLLCLTENYHTITPDDVRPRLNLQFEVMLKTGDYVVPDGIYLGKFGNGTLFNVFLDTGCSAKFHMEFDTAHQLKQSTNRPCMKGLNTIIINEKEFASIIIRVNSPDGWKEFDVCLNNRGTVIGVPAFPCFGQVFTYDVEHRKFEFVNRP